MDTTNPDRPLDTVVQRALETLAAAGGRWAHAVDLFGPLPPYAVLGRLQAAGLAAHNDGMYAITAAGRDYLYLFTEKD